MLRLITLVFFFLMVACDSKSRWLVYYGDHFSEKNLKGLSFAILEPDHFSPSSLPSRGETQFLGYLSIGEIHPSRPYWNLIKDKPFVIERNDVWGSFRVDIRSKEWQQFLLEQIIPGILRKGYDGLFLDTIDTALYFETRNPERFSGSTNALVSFLKELKKKFPEVLLVPNNGLELLGELGPIIDGVVVEDLYFKTSVEEDRVKEAYLNTFIRKYQKPVLVLFYESDPENPWVKEALKRCKKRGYDSFVTDIGLSQLPK